MIETTFDTVARIWADGMNLPKDQITLGTTIIGHDECDSLDRADFLMTIEEQFGVELPDRVCCDMKTIGDVVAAVDARAARPQP